MRTHGLLVVILLAACRDSAHRKPPVHAHTRAPIGLVGSWVQIRPDSVRGDTLTLRADFRASGLVPRYQGDTLIMHATRWKVQFTSHDPVAMRGDWYGGREDGGDVSCVFGNDSTCVSGPLLCIGDTTAYQCVAFRFGRDSLSLSTGARFVRASVTGNGLAPREF